VHTLGILKIIFNFGQIVRFLGNVGLYMTPSVATLIQCAALQYFIMAGNVMTRLSLTAFLLWRMRQIDMSGRKIDNWICIILFLIRTAFMVNFLLKYNISLSFSF
jgi:hypothetical protein